MLRILQEDHPSGKAKININCESDIYEATFDSIVEFLGDVVNKFVSMKSDIVKKELTEYEEFLEFKKMKAQAEQAKLKQEPLVIPALVTVEAVNEVATPQATPQDKPFLSSLELFLENGTEIETCEQYNLGWMAFDNVNNEVAVKPTFKLVIIDEKPIDGKIATISEDGVINTIAEGQIKVVATAGKNGKTSTLTLNINDPIVPATIGTTTANYKKSQYKKILQVMSQGNELAQFTPARPIDATLLRALNEGELLELR
jgi:hypothetical protein